MSESDSQDSNMRASGHLSRVLAGGLFALFFGLLIQAFAVFGVITMTSGHIFMFLAWIVGALLIITEIIPGKPARHKVASVIVLGVVLLGGDLLAVMYATNNVTQEKAAPQSSQPSVSATPAQTASPIPAVVPTQTPTPSPSPSVPKSYSKRPKASQQIPCTAEERLLGKC